MSLKDGPWTNPIWEEIRQRQDHFSGGAFAWAGSRFNLATAEPGSVAAGVLRQVAMLVGAGVVAGSVASVWAARYAGSLLYGLEPGDPGTLASSAAVLMAIGALSGWLPARRAARIDPARVLRDQ